MQIQNGKLYDNRTWRYLYPTLKTYGSELMTYLAQFFKLGVGIGDYNVDTNEPCIFILIDTNIMVQNQQELDLYKTKFARFLNWIRYQFYYVTDYVYEGLDSKEKHMVVLRLPYKFDKAYLSFIQGEYSKMYPKSEILDYFKHITMVNKVTEKKVNDRLTETRKILQKDSSYIPIFANKVNKMFNTDNPDSDFIDAELDFPPNLEEEVFNYRKNEDKNN